MLDFGTSAAHANSYDYGDIEQMDLTESYGVGIKLLPNSGAAVNQDFLGKSNIAGAVGQGWFVRSGSSNHLIPTMWHNLDVSNGVYTVNSAISSSAVTSLFFRWDKANTTGYAHALGQPEKVTTGISTVPTTHTMPFAIGAGGDDVANGYACRVGQVMVWSGYFPTAIERDMYHQGIFVPAPGKLSLFVRCINENSEGVDDQSSFGETGTEQGTVTAVGDDVDSLFAGLGTVVPNRQLSGYDLRLFACSPNVYQVTVPNNFQGVDIGDTLQLADGDIPSADSLRGTLSDHFMLDDWRHIFSHILEVSAGRHETTFTVMDIVPASCFAWGTDALVDGEVVNDEQHGTAIFFPYADMSNDRNSTHFIVDSTEDNQELRLAPVAQFSAKINHRGNRFEHDYTNIMSNSHFLIAGAGPPTFDGWTETIGTGGEINSTDVDTSGGTLLVRDETIFTYTQPIAELKQGSSGDTYIEGTTETTDSSGIAMVSFWWKGAAKYYIQRSSDSRYWDGDSWEVAQTWFEVTSGIPWEREDRYINTGVPNSGTLNVAIGANGSQNDLVHVGNVMVVQDWAKHTDIISLDSSIAASADVAKWNYDNGGSGDVQLFNPNHGTVRVRVRFPHDSSQIPNDTNLPIWSNYIDGNNHDTLSLRKTSGGTLQWEFRRIESATDRGAAVSASVSYSEGDEVEIAARWVSASGGELGLSARTISVFVAGTKGTDATPSALLDDTANDTSIYIGSVPGTSHNLPGGTVQTCELILKNWEIKQYAVADEAILAGRVAA